jgi:YesN/AraC family two-component response regulator
MVIFLGISNSFFEETSLFSTNNKKSSTADFLEKFVTRRKEPFQYLRLIPRDNTKRKTGKLLSRIIVEMARRESGYERIVEGCTERIINCLPREYEMKVHAQTRKEKELEILDKILLFIHEHYQEISITDLCAEFGLNRDYYNRLIKKHTGLTYSRYLENTRLEKALALLKSTNNTVESIARAVGYENQGFFYKRFFEKYGKKPRAVRE